MVQFVSFAPGVEVLGASMMANIEGMGEKAIPLLARHGLANLEPDKWYPLQNYLDFYKELASMRQGGIDLVSVGQKVPEKAVFPPQIDSIQSAFQLLDEAYHMNHRGGDIGHYHVKLVGSRQIDIIAQNPFPCDLDLGIISGLANRFRPEKAHPIAYHDILKPCRKHGADYCVYHVSWW
jgi:hypothetical protein